MKIDILHSGSSGNAIVVSDGHSSLLLDCGVSFSKLSQSVKISELAGVFVSHSHTDHCKAVPELNRRGINLLMSEGTASEIEGQEITLLSRNLIKHGHQYDIGSWLLMPFDAVHDTQEPMGLLFQSTLTGEKGIYIVDSGYVEYDFKGVTHYLIECNYAEELLEAGPYDEHLKDRVRRNHYSLENLEVFLSTSDLSQTEEIWLLHLSDANSDEQMFQQEIQALTGVPTYVAN